MIKNIKYYVPFNTSKDMYIYIYFFLQVTSQMITSSHAFTYYFTQCKAIIISHTFFSSSVTNAILIHSSKFSPKVTASQH